MNYNNYDKNNNTNNNNNDNNNNNNSSDNNSTKNNDDDDDIFLFPTPLFVCSMLIGVAVCIWQLLCCFQNLLKCFDIDPLLVCIPFQT